MYSFRQSRFGGGQDPWFRVGTWDIGSAGIAAGLVIIGMLIVAFEGAAAPVTDWLVFHAPDVARGQAWRIFTWFIPSAIGLWTLISAFMIFSFGSQMEGALGKVKMAEYLAVLVAIPAVLSLIFYATGIFNAPIGLAGGNLLSQSLFFAFVLYMPGAKFFFGIPGWVIAAVVIVLQLLSYLQARDSGAAVNFLASLVGIALATKAFGLADDIPQIPKIRNPRSKSKSTATISTISPAGSRGVSDHELADQRFRELDIDPILDQIAAFGVESLSDAQRQRLESFSKKNKKGRGN